MGIGNVARHEQDMKRGPEKDFIPGRLGNNWGIGDANDEDEERPRGAYNAYNKQGKKKVDRRKVLGLRVRARDNDEGWRSKGQQ